MICNSSPSLPSFESTAALPPSQPIVALARRGCGVSCDVVPLLALAWPWLDLGPASSGEQTFCPSSAVGKGFEAVACDWRCHRHREAPLGLQPVPASFESCNHLLARPPPFPLPVSLSSERNALSPQPWTPPFPSFLPLPKPRVAMQCGSPSPTASPHISLVFILPFLDAMGR